MHEENSVGKQSTAHGTIQNDGKIAEQFQCPKNTNLILLMSMLMLDFGFEMIYVFEWNALSLLSE